MTDRLSAAIDNLNSLLLQNLNNVGLPDDFRDERVQMPNIQFSPPNDKSPWMRVSYSPVGQISTDASGCYEQNACFYSVSLFYQKGVGTDAPMRIIAKIKRLFHLYQVEDLVVESADVMIISTTENSVWFGVKVDVYFTYESFTDQE